MTKTLIRLVGIVTMVAAGLHLTSDILEFFSGGFSRMQLLINYIGFLPMPLIIIGLYSAQRPRIREPGLTGAVLYAVSFIYFTHTTLIALEDSIPTYEALWDRLGSVYTLHGALMVIGGVLFGIASLRAGVLKRTWVWLFTAGVVINLCISLLPLPDVVQIAGSTVRNAGLIGMGWELLKPLEGVEPEI